MQNSSSNNSIFHGSLIIPSNTSFTDDIECDLWLKEIDLNQYTNSFLSNCTIPIGSIYLSRKRLSQIRQQDLSKMNITNFQHQKIIMEHIRHTLQYSFASPARLQELIQRHGSTPFGVHIPSDNEYSMSNLMKVNQAAHNLKNVHFAKEGRRASLVRRESISVERLSSFDSQVRQQIQRLQSSNQQHHHAVENLRENKDISNNVSTDNHHQKIQIRKKYVNLDEKNQPKDLATKGLTYGKMAMEYDRLLLQLKKLQYDQITYYKQIIECESASIFFHDSNSRELIMYLDESWNRFPNNLGIVGYCFHSGETVNVSNASNDDRFRYVSMQFTYLKTVQ